MSYRITYTDRARSDLQAMPRSVRTDFEGAMRKTLGRDPYGHGSEPMKSREPDRRIATVHAAVVRYQVTTGLVLMVTALEIAHLY
ncbi:hypothetical protein ACIP88_17345 [Streptomyces uncialis]|uniref:hypothetical protein n=1 Tax=Streptomyces uncialis TaxID=1048205 RepID=UPI00381B4A1C